LLLRTLWHILLVCLKNHKYVFVGFIPDLSTTIADNTEETPTNIRDIVT
jgi:hypothetical protein